MATTSTPPWAGEPPGRWWGLGTHALGFTPGQIVERQPYGAVYRQIGPRTGAKLGRHRGRYTTYADHLARLKAAEPHATAERLIELERQAAQATRQPAVYTDVTVSFSKSVWPARLPASRLAASMPRREKPNPTCKFQMLTGRLNRDITPGPGGPSALKPIQAEDVCGVA